MKRCLMENNEGPHPTSASPDTGGPIRLERCGAVSRRADPSREAGPSRDGPIRLEKRGRLETALDVYRRGDQLRLIMTNYD